MSRRPEVVWSEWVYSDGTVFDEGKPGHPDVGHTVRCTGECVIFGRTYYADLCADDRMLHADGGWERLETTKRTLVKGRFRDVAKGITDYRPLPYNLIGIQFEDPESYPKLAVV